MKATKCITISLMIIFLAAGVVLAQDPVVYPAKGQSQDQVEKDKYECYSWAKKESGFDPMQQPKATAPPPPQEAPKGGAGRGAAGGAATGAVIGKLAKDDAGKGAAIGAATGAVVGGSRRRQQQQQQQQAQQQYAQQQSATYTKNRDAYNRAYGACLEGRGYSVK